MVRIGPLSIGVLGLATIALLVPVVQGFTKAGGVATARGAGAGLAGFLGDPLGSLGVTSFLSGGEERGTADAIRLQNEADRLRAEADRLRNVQSVPGVDFLGRFGDRVEFVDPARPTIPIGGAGGFGFSSVIDRRAQDLLDAERRALAGSGGFF